MVAFPLHLATDRRGAAAAEMALVLPLLVTLLLIGIVLLCTTFIRLAFSGEGFGQRVVYGGISLLFIGLGFIAVRDFLSHVRRAGGSSSGGPPLEPSRVPHPSGGKPPTLSATAYASHDTTA